MTLVEITEVSEDHVKRTQFVRGIDIVIIAPFLFYLAKKGSVSQVDKVVLLAIIGTTFYFNLNNYLKRL